MAAPASTKQSPTLTTLWDYEVDVAGNALVKAPIEVTLNYDLATMSSPAVILEAVKRTTTCDSNGQWAIDLVPNANISPANTTYTVRTPMRSFQVTVPTSSPAQASANLVNTPVLPGQTSALGGNLTVAGTTALTGLLTASGGISVAGHVLVSGSVPTVTLNINANVNGILVAGTDTAFRVQFNVITGTIAAASRLFTVSLATTYNNPPFPVAGGSLAIWHPEAAQNGNNAIDIYTVDALPVGNNYGANVICFGY